MKTGPLEPRSMVLSEVEEALIVDFRKHPLPPLDDCLYARDVADHAGESFKWGMERFAKNITLKRMSETKDVAAVV